MTTMSKVQQEVLAMREAGRVAQQEFEKWPQEKVDEAVRAVGKAVYDEAEMLAKLAVDETRMGRYEDKILKNKGKTKAVWNKIKHEKSREIIRYLDDEGLVEVAKPIGVIGAVTPVTNPTMTPVQNAMIALKGGNALICSPHPRGRKSGLATINLMRDALAKLGAPVDLLQIIEEPSLEHTQAVMELCDASIATGGPGMVKAAYSSGKPSFGVGAGNVQAIADNDVAVADYIDLVVAGRTYDNGVLCTCEQTLIIPEAEKIAVREALIARGGFLVPTNEMDNFREKLFPETRINPDVVGQTAHRIGELTGLDVPSEATFIFVEVEEHGPKELFSKEKLCPVLTVNTYKNWDEAVTIAKENLNFEGAGHSAVIHSQNKQHIEELAETLPISRLVVNQQGSSGLGGAMTNGLNPTATLGCGSWGNNSLSENLWWNHLVNISRISYTIKDRVVPTDDEIWG